MRLALFASLAVACAEPAVPNSGPDAAPDGAALDVNDVSILVPLPATVADRAHVLWLAPHAGEEGPFFPVDAPATLGDLNGDVPTSLGYPAAMVVGIRFDPCFPRPDGGCQAQLRLVAQPVLPSNEGATMLDDAAVHLFYALDAMEADEVIAALRAIRAGSPVATTGPLRVHPGLAVDLAGATGKRVRDLVVDHAREDNLVRITTNAFAMDNWGFRKFDRVDGALVAQPIAGLTEPSFSQAWLRQAQRDSLDDPSGTMQPASADGFSYLLSAASFSTTAPVDPSKARIAAERLLAVENPVLTTTEETDCAGCHLASQARLFAERHGVAFEGAAKFVPPAGVSATLDLAPELQGNLGATISFGYHTRTAAATPTPVPSISQRTVNESARIAASLGAR